jgi:subtilisin family serine protease
VPDSVPADNLLDPAAGHGTFIAGVVEQVAPGAKVEVWHVLEPEGDGSAVDIATRIDALPARNGPGDRGCVLNLSFGGYVLEQGDVLASAILEAQAWGYVVVSSAGNDGVCTPDDPGLAARRGRRGRHRPRRPRPVQQLPPLGPSLHPRRGPGEHVLPPVPGRRDARHPAGPRPRQLRGLGPLVGHVVLRSRRGRRAGQHARVHQVSMADAVTQVIDNPLLLRIADLGTVVNVL